MPTSCFIPSCVAFLPELQSQLGLWRPSWLHVLSGRASTCLCVATGKASLGLSLAGCTSGFWPGQAEAWIHCELFTLQQSHLITFLLGCLEFVESSPHLHGLRHDFSIQGTHCCHYTNGQWRKDVPGPASQPVRARLGLEATFLLQFKASFYLIAVYLLTLFMSYGGKSLFA